MKKKKKQPANQDAPSSKITMRKRWPVFFNSPYLWLAGILLLTCFLFSNLIYNDFIFYDDDVYILDNDLIKDLSWGGIKRLFTSFYYYGYIPITLLTYAFEYMLWGNTAYPYLITNLFFHLINTVLVYKFIYMVSRRSATGLVVALFFAIHPMHVESVAWIAERKDVLFLMFYMIAAIYYYKYLTSNLNVRFLIYCTIFVIFSMLSKPSGMTFPGLMVLLNYFSGRKFDKRALIEILALCLVLLGFGLFYMSVHELTHTENISFRFWERIFMGGYAFVFYIIRAFVPYNISLLYPYPPQDEPLPTNYYAATLLAILFVAALGYHVYKNHKKSKHIVFGFLFFLVHISLVLHIAKAIGGVVVVADRYTYLPYIGLFYWVAESYFTSKKKYFKNLLLLALAVSTVTFSAITYQRVKVWRNGETIFKDAVAKYPKAWLGYNNIGVNYNKKKMYAEAIPFFDNAIKYHPRYVKAYYNRGNSKSELAMYEEAIVDYTKAIELDRRHFMAFYNRGLAYYNLDRLEEALQDYNKALDLKNDYAEAYNSRGWVLFLMEDYDNALSDFNKSIAIDARSEITFNNRGWMKYATGDFDGAMHDFDMALAQNPDFELTYINRGWLRYEMEDYMGALTDFNVAADINPENIKTYINRSLVNLKLENFDAVCNDWHEAAMRGSHEAASYFNAYCKETEPDS